MSKEAIERVEGFCAKVDNETWSVLMNTAFGMNILIEPDAILNGPTTGFPYAAFNFSGQLTLWSDSRKKTLIPFPDFLAKLKGQCHSLKEVGPISFGGTEQWTPKAGEMVDAHYGMGCDWEESIFIGMDGDYYVCRKASYGPSGYRAHAVNDIRPITPTITRAEAEQQLGKRIID